jgi:FeS assembly protein IscX
VDTFGWEDAEDIGIALYEKFPELDPLSVRFTDLHEWVCELEEFEDDPKTSTEGKLEAIQMAWLEEYKDAQGD